MSKKDELAEVIASELNKQSKSHQVAYFLDGVQETPTDVTDWISTGSGTRISVLTGSLLLLVLEPLY